MKPLLKFHCYEPIQISRWKKKIHKMETKSCLVKRGSSLRRSCRNYQWQCSFHHLLVSLAKFFFKCLRRKKLVTPKSTISIYQELTFIRKNLPKILLPIFGRLWLKYSLQQFFSFFSSETKIMLRFTPLDQENFYVHIWLYLLKRDHVLRPQSNFKFTRAQKTTNFAV